MRRVVGPRLTLIGAFRGWGGGRIELMMLRRFIQLLGFAAEIGQNNVKHDSKRRGEGGSEFNITTAFISLEMLLSKTD